MKRIVCSLVLAVAVAGCGGSSVKPAPPATAPRVAGTPTAVTYSAATSGSIRSYLCQMGPILSAFSRAANSFSSVRAALDSGLPDTATANAADAVAYYEKIQNALAGIQPPDQMAGSHRLLEAAAGRYLAGAQAVDADLRTSHASRVARDAATYDQGTPYFNQAQQEQDAVKARLAPGSSTPCTSTVPALALAPTPTPTSLPTPAPPPTPRPGSKPTAGPGTAQPIGVPRVGTTPLPADIVRWLSSLESAFALIESADTSMHLAGSIYNPRDIFPSMAKFGQARSIYGKAARTLAQSSPPAPATGIQTQVIQATDLYIKAVDAIRHSIIIGDRPNLYGAVPLVADGSRNMRAAGRGLGNLLRHEARGPAAFGISAIPTLRLRIVPITVHPKNTLSAAQRARVLDVLRYVTEETSGVTQLQKVAASLRKVSHLLQQQRAPDVHGAIGGAIRALRGNQSREAALRPPVAQLKSVQLANREAITSLFTAARQLRLAAIDLAGGNTTAATREIQSARDSVARATASLAISRQILTGSATGGLAARQTTLTSVTCCASGQIAPDSGVTSSTFTVHGSWSLQYSTTCGNVPTGAQPGLFISVAPKGSRASADVLQIPLTHGRTTGTVLEHLSGTFYLRILCGCQSWRVTVLH